MSSDHELASYSPTTPFRPATKSTKTNTKGSTAGPSSKPVSSASNRLKRARRVVVESETVEVSETESQDARSSDDENNHTAEPRKAKDKAKNAHGSKGESVLNGGVKGKGRSKAQPKGRRAKPTEAVTDLEMDADAKSLNAKAGSTSTRHSKQDETSKELARLQERFDQVEAENKEMAKQLEALTHLRESEPERALQEQAARYDAQVKAQETLINDLNSRLARVEPMVRSGKSTILEFFSREAVDAEKQALAKENVKLTASVKDRDTSIAQKSERIAELERRLKEVQGDLKAEIERSKVLSSKPPPPSSQKRTPVGTAGENIKNTEVLRLYEDATNLLITNVRYQKGLYLDYEDCILTCIYTYINQNSSSDDHEGAASLSFTLRLFYDLQDQDDMTVTSPDQLCRSIHYIPLDLDKESPEFVKQLDFLSSPFTFRRHQLPLFLTQIYNKMEAICGDAEEDMNED